MFQNGNIILYFGVIINGGGGLFSEGFVCLNYYLNPIQHCCRFIKYVA